MPIFVISIKKQQLTYFYNFISNVNSSSISWSIFWTPWRPHFRTDRLRHDPLVRRILLVMLPSLVFRWWRATYEHIVTRTINACNDTCVKPIPNVTRISEALASSVNWERKFRNNFSRYTTSPYKLLMES